MLGNGGPWLVSRFCRTSGVGGELRVRVEASGLWGYVERAAAGREPAYTRTCACS